MNSIGALINLRIVGTIILWPTMGFLLFLLRSTYTVNMLVLPLSSRGSCWESHMVCELSLGYITASDIALVRVKGSHVGNQVLIPVQFLTLGIEKT